MSSYYELRPNPNRANDYYGQNQANIRLQLQPIFENMNLDVDLFDGFVDPRNYSCLNLGNSNSKRNGRNFYDRNVIVAPVPKINYPVKSPLHRPEPLKLRKKKAKPTVIANKAYYPASEESDDSPPSYNTRTFSSQRSAIPVYLYENYDKHNKYLPKSSRRVYKCKETPAECCHLKPPEICCTNIGEVPGPSRQRTSENHDRISKHSQDHDDLVYHKEPQSSIFRKNDRSTSKVSYQPLQLSPRSSIKYESPALSLKASQVLHRKPSSQEMQRKSASLEVHSKSASQDVHNKSESQDEHRKLSSLDYDKRRSSYINPIREEVHRKSHGSEQKFVSTESPEEMAKECIAVIDYNNTDCCNEIEERVLALEKRMNHKLTPSEIFTKVRSSSKIGNGSFHIVDDHQRKSESLDAGKHSSQILIKQEQAPEGRPSCCYLEPKKPSEPLHVTDRNSHGSVIIHQTPSITKNQPSCCYTKKEKAIIDHHRKSEPAHIEERKSSKIVIERVPVAKDKPSCCYFEHEKQSYADVDHHHHEHHRKSEGISMNERRSLRSTHSNSITVSEQKHPSLEEKMSFAIVDNHDKHDHSHHSLHHNHHGADDKHSHHHDQHGHHDHLDQHKNHSHKHNHQAHVDPHSNNHGHRDHLDQHKHQDRHDYHDHHDKYDNQDQHSHHSNNHDRHNHHDHHGHQNHHHGHHRGHLHAHHHDHHKDHNHKGHHEHHGTSDTSSVSHAPSYYSSHDGSFSLSKDEYPNMHETSRPKSTRIRLNAKKISKADASQSHMKVGHKESKKKIKHDSGQGPFSTIKTRTLTVQKLPPVSVLPCEQVCDICNNICAQSHHDGIPCECLAVFDDKIHLDRNSRLDRKSHLVRKSHIDRKGNLDRKSHLLRKSNKERKSRPIQHTEDHENHQQTQHQSVPTPSSPETTQINRFSNRSYSSPVYSNDYGSGSTQSRSKSAEYSGAYSEGTVTRSPRSSDRPTLTSAEISGQRRQSGESGYRNSSGTTGYTPYSNDYSSSQRYSSGAGASLVPLGRGVYKCHSGTCANLGPAAIEVGYATTIVTRFRKYTVYEVLRPSLKRPPNFCRVTENVFVVKNIDIGYPKH